MANHHYYYQPQLNCDLIEQQSHHAMINPNLISGQNSQFVANSNYMNNMQRFMGQQNYNTGIYIYIWAYKVFYDNFLFQDY